MAEKRKHIMESANGRLSQLLLAYEGTAAGKRPRTEEAGIVLPPNVPMESVDSLNANGAFVFPIGNAAEGAAFVAQLRVCTNDWFHTNFKLMLDEPLPVMFKIAKPPYAAKPDMIESAAEWNTMTAEQKASYRMMIDLRTDYGMSMAFDISFVDKEFKKQPFVSMPGKSYFRQALIYTKQGNSGTSTGANVSTAWAKNGFGKWVHICPDIGLGMVVEAMKVMENLGLTPGLPNHFPHPIYKPPSGTPLEIHHDQMTPADLVRNLRVLVSSSDPSMSAWVARYGIQMLAHVQGGTGIHNGATFIVGPMTPAKMLICLDTFAVMSRDGDYDKWIARGKGIHFLDVEKYLPAFNNALQQAGFGPVGLVPIAPTNLQAFSGGFGLGFPVGMWHGSFSNAGNEDQAVGKGSRVTITMPLTLRGAEQKIDDRIPTRLRHMATVSTEGLPKERYEAAGAWLANDTVVYAFGATHLHPERILNYICCPSAATALGLPVGPYHSISVKPKSVANYLAVLEAIQRGSAAGPSSAPPPVEPMEPVEPMDENADDELLDNVPLSNLVPGAPLPVYKHSNLLTLRSPPSPNVLTDTDVRLVKVKQPWAEALVKGQKNVENRRWFLNPSTGFPAWVLVVASKSIPTEAYMKDYTARLTRQAGPGATGPGPTTTTRKWSFLRGKIVGMIRVAGCYPQEKMPIQSVWYNPPDIGWVVDEAWSFDDAIDLEPDDKFQTQVSLRQRQQYTPRLIEEIRKLQSNYQ